MKTVMYHYINRGGETPPFGYYYLDRNNFTAQLDHFAKHYDVLDRERFLETVHGERVPGESEIVLTFDDGLADHYDHVLPELNARGMWGIFYVPAGPYLDGTALDVHRIHALLGTCGGEAVATELDALIDKSMLDADHVNAFSGVVYDRQDNDDPTERVKEILNYYIADQHRSGVLRELEDVLIGGQSYHDGVYMTRDQLRELAAEGMLVGSHTVTHRVMSTLQTTEQRREIKESFAFLEETLDGLAVRTYCHPYGGDHSYDDSTLDILDEVDCKFSFDVDARDLTWEDVDTGRQRLPRYDCNEFPHGESTVSLGRDFKKD